MQTNKRPFLLVLAGSILFSLSFPGFIFKEGLGFLAWFCFVPVFEALKFLPFKKSFPAGFLFGLVSYSIIVYWLFNYSVVMLVLGVVYSALIYGLLFMGIKCSFLYCRKVPVFTAVLLITAFEYVKSKGFLGFGYGVTGYTQWKYNLILSVASVSGVSLVSFIVISSSGLLFSIFERFSVLKEIKRITHNESFDSSYSPVSFAARIEELKKEASFIKTGIFALAFVLFLFALVFYGEKTKPDFSSLETKKIISIQHNEIPGKDGIAVYTENLNRLMYLTREAVSLYPEADLVVWPETAVTPSVLFQYYQGKDKNRIALVKSLLEFIENCGKPVLLGNYNAYVDREKGKVLDYNSVLFFEPGKNVLPPEPGIYSKIHLVPLSEYLPYAEKLPAVMKILSKLGANNWTPGTEYKVFELGELKFGTPVCFEDTFGELCRNMVLNGAECFINLSNDSWGKSRACQNQHLSMAVFRSAENHVPSCRSTASGESCFISASGEVYGKVPSFIPTFTYSEIPVLGKSYKKTLYTRYGDTAGLFALCASLVLLIIGFIKGIIKSWQNR